MSETCSGDTWKPRALRDAGRCMGRARRGARGWFISSLPLEDGGVHAVQGSGAARPHGDAEAVEEKAQAVGAGLRADDDAAARVLQGAQLRQTEVYI